jgi:predicted TIM-barrel fold metal-dependent hydrolase
MFVPPRLDPSAQEFLHASLGVDRTVLVHSFAFGDKLESLHDWVAKDPASRRAVCVLPPTQLDVDADRQFIKRLDGASVRGVRAELEGDDRATKVRALKKVFERLDRAGVRWTVCVQELDAAFYDAVSWP